MKALRIAAFSVLLAGCSAAPLAPKTVSMRLRGTPADAQVTVDDRYLGALAFVAKHGVALPPGKHRITIEKAGFFPWDREVSASEAPIVLDVALEKIPD